MLTEVILTQLGETMNEGTIASWYKQVGERVEKGEPLCAVETDKTVLDLESPACGYLARIVALAGVTVPVLQVIGYLVDQQDELAAQPALTAPASGGAKSESVQAAAQADPNAPAPAALEPAPFTAVSPAARRIAKEHGVDPRQIVGTGPGGRVVESDVWALIQTNPTAPQAPDATVPASADNVESPVAASQPLLPAVGDWDLLPLSRMRRIIAEKLSQSYREAVHVTLHAEVDMAEASNLRTLLIREWEPTHGVKVTFTDLIVRAVAMALAEHRAINASFTTEAIRLHRHINIGVAVAVADGLVVPVIRDADGLPLIEICRAVRKLTDRARSGRVNLDELQGGTFTVTNMGVLGIDTFTPIINGSEGGILGVGRVADKPAARAGQLTIRPLMPLSLSFDHRVVDGAGAAAFLCRVRQLLESPDLILADHIKRTVDMKAKQEIIGFGCQDRGTG